MRILADANVPEEYVSALRGDGHEVEYSRDVDELGATATDLAITEYAEANELAILTTDAKDFGDRAADVPVLVAPQDMTGGEVRAAVSRLVSLSFDLYWTTVVNEPPVAASRPLTSVSGRERGDRLAIHSVV